MTTTLAVLSYAEVLPGNLRTLRTAAASRGVRLVEVPPHELVLHLGGGPAVVRRGAATFSPDVVLHRTVWPYRDHVGPLLAALPCPVLNPFPAARLSRSKAATLQVLAAAGLPVVPTAVHAGPAPPPPAPPPGGASVAKPSLGTQGRGVLRLDADGLRRRLAEDYDDRDGPVLVQPLLAAPHDLRAYVVGPACVGVGARSPAPGEWRGNVALGGTLTAVPDRGLADRAGQLAVAAVAALGLDHAAVDLLLDDGRPVLSEVDAWGGWQGLEAGLGLDVGAALVDLALERCGAG